LAETGTKFRFFIREKPSRAPGPAQKSGAARDSGKEAPKLLSLAGIYNIRVLASYQRRRLEFRLSGNRISRLKISRGSVTENC
jgi:hypothetical protein